jgi:hypothetical protein
VSYLEVYNETVRDLAASPLQEDINAGKLELRESGDGVVVPGLTVVRLSTQPPPPTPTPAPFPTPAPTPHRPLCLSWVAPSVTARVRLSARVCGGWGDSSHVHTNQERVCACACALCVCVCEGMRECTWVCGKGGLRGSLLAHCTCSCGHTRVYANKRGRVRLRGCVRMDPGCVWE